MQRSKCKNANPKKPAGLADAQTRVSGLAKYPGYPGTRVFQNPGFNPYSVCLSNEYDEIYSPHRQYGQ